VAASSGAGSAPGSGSVWETSKTNVVLKETPDSISQLRCERRNRGVLLWHRSSNEVIVAVLDKKRGGTFEVPVEAGQRALDVFLYPFAHRRSSSKPDLDP
jgi:hypothetical protein